MNIFIGIGILNDDDTNYNAKIFTYKLDFILFYVNQ